MYKDGHHIIHNRMEWSLRPEAKLIRDTPSLIVRMDRSDHDEIHRYCPPVPLLGYHALIRTLQTFEQGETPLKTMDNLMYSIEIASKHPKAHEIEKQLANLAIWAIDLQRPFIAGVLQNERK